MCDTQVFRSRGRICFAKNSDREADEPQYLRYHPAVRGDPAPAVRTTYIDVAQVPDRYAMILSQPSWLWGAEMGINECGLVIGNEAVFTRVVAREGAALLGMDILRLALERCRSATAAIGCIDGLLRRYGQGGPAGYRDKHFRYDNSFIIADPLEAWVLETAAQHWVARRVDSFDAISNTLCITDDFDLHSDGLHGFARARGRYNGRGKLDFARAFDTRFMPFMGRARQRRACSLAALGGLDSPDLRAMAANLRLHASDQEDFARHGNADVCLHAGGLLRPSQTTGSMLVRLGQQEPPEIYLTGTSAPCLSLFQPVSFEAQGRAAPAILDGSASERSAPWHRFEPVHQQALADREFARRLRASRDALEPAMFDSSLAIEVRSRQARDWLAHWSREARSADPACRWYSPYDRFWHARRVSARDML